MADYRISETKETHTVSDHYMDTTYTSMRYTLVSGDKVLGSYIDKDDAKDAKQILEKGASRAELTATVRELEKQQSDLEKQQSDLERQLDKVTWACRCASRRLEVAKGLLRRKQEAAKAAKDILDTIDD